MNDYIAIMAASAFVNNVCDARPLVVGKRYSRIHW